MGWDGMVAQETNIHCNWLPEGGQQEGILELNKE